MCRVQRAGVAIGVFVTVVIMWLSQSSYGVALTFGAVISWPTVRLIELVGKTSWFYGHRDGWWGGWRLFSWSTLFSA